MSRGVSYASNTTDLPLMVILSTSDDSPQAVTCHDGANMTMTRACDGGMGPQNTITLGFEDLVPQRPYAK